MPKRIFWPIALIIMGTVVLAANLKLLPMEFFNLWPLILIIVGLGGLLLSDKEQWDTEKGPRSSSVPARKTVAKPVAKKAPVKKKAGSRKK